MPEWPGTSRSYPRWTNCDTPTPILTCMASATKDNGLLSCTSLTSSIPGTPGNLTPTLKNAIFLCFCDWLLLSIGALWCQLTAVEPGWSDSSEKRCCSQSHSAFINPWLSVQCCMLGSLQAPITLFCPRPTPWKVGFLPFDGEKKGLKRCQIFFWLAKNLQKMKIFGLANFRTSFTKTITNNPSSVIQASPFCSELRLRCKI